MGIPAFRSIIAARSVEIPGGGAFVISSMRHPAVSQKVKNGMNILFEDLRRSRMQSFEEKKPKWVH
ncbi:hypothetical protein [Rhizobium sp. G21]|uniref:hypothetical protein n=1 Tax=Rhizobium sp. G21 TaxID=2758439 RepID=UPI0016013FAB|nr:hypothetical protein [Rhizobium sp. G21]MBB1248228.1 hypothetical protein [Rhizobium sp. G21]